MLAAPAAASRLLSHRPLFDNLVRREVRQRYKGSVIGLMWTLINPIIMVGVYSVVFRYLLRFDSISPYALFLFVGLTAWTFFSGGVQVATSSLVSNSHLVTKVAFPREIVPLAAITANAFTAAAMLAIALPLCLFFAPLDGYQPLVILPVLIALLAALTVGLSLLLAALNVYFRDTEYLYGALSLPWFFLSPIFYTYEVLSGVDSWVINVLHYVNFASPFILSLQDVLFFGRWPDPIDVAYMAVASAIALGVGWWTFRRLERDMALQL